MRLTDRINATPHRRGRRKDYVHEERGEGVSLVEEERQSRGLLDAVARIDEEEKGRRLEQQKISHLNGSATDVLSARELEVLQLLAQGLTYQQIALSLDLSTSTIRTFLHSTYGKLGVVDRAQAVLVATRRGFISTNGLHVEEGESMAEKVDRLRDEGARSTVRQGRPRPFLPDPDRDLLTDSESSSIPRYPADGVLADVLIAKHLKVVGSQEEFDDTVRELEAADSPKQRRDMLVKLAAICQDMAAVIDAKRFT